MLRRFANEESVLVSKCPEYQPKEISEQVAILRRFLPIDIGLADESLAIGTLPAKTENWIAIPRWEYIAPTYGEAAQSALYLLRSARRGAFFNYCQGKLEERHLRRSDRTINALQRIAIEQAGQDVLIIPIQSGALHAGRSVRRARAVMAANEFGLGVYEIAIMILLYPERFQHRSDLKIDCAGDEFAPESKGAFSWVPYFAFSDDEVELGVRPIDQADGTYGSASAFIV